MRMRAFCNNDSSSNNDNSSNSNDNSSKASLRPYERSVARATYLSTCSCSIREVH